MFSYLRPHRRTPSTPTSPVPEQLHSWDAPLHPTLDHAHPQRFQDAPSQDSQTKISPPPSLPPIERAPSPSYDISSQYHNESSRLGIFEKDSKAQHWEPSKANARAWEVHTSGNHQRTPLLGTQRPESAGNVAPTKYGTSQYSKPHTGMNNESISRQLPLDQTSPFPTAADLQSKTQQFNRRPTGARLPTPPPSTSNSSSAYEPVQARSGKARLNLLNPMSLLARRRTSQAITQLAVESQASNRTGKDFSTTFDPRIRGTVVHDFSAPRPPRRNVSYNDVRREEKSSKDPRPYQRSPKAQHAATNMDENPNGPWSGGNYTPVFTENFEEEQYPAAGPHVRRASDLSDLTLPKPPYAKGAAQISAERNSMSMSESRDSSQRQFDVRKEIITGESVSDVGPPVPPKFKGELPKVPRRISIDPASTPPKSTASSRKGPSRNASKVHDEETVILALPKHMTSTSSRFSFDMIGAAEQERLLEDRHRQKALEKRSDPDDPYDEAEDYYDYDHVNDDDGLEEKIPGVNADADEDDFGGLLNYDDGLEGRIPGVNVDSDEDYDGAIDDGENMAGFTFQQSSLTSPLSPYTPGMVTTPRDFNGDVIGFAMTKNSPYISSHMAHSLNASPITSALRDVGIPMCHSGVQGLGLQGVEVSSPLDAEIQSLSYEIAPASEFPVAAAIDDDDLYFDDGIIDELGEDEEAVEFDESVFDNVDTDQYGRPLNSFTSLPTLYSPPTLTTDASPSFAKIYESDEFSLKSPPVKDDAVSSGTISGPSGLAPRTSIAGNEFSPTAIPSYGFTEDTLAAYQSALAAAAHTAAANGKFRRDSVPATLSPTPQEGTHPSLIPDSSHTSHYEPFSPSYELEDDFDYDDALEDDPIVAAANAEALANDYDGFYSQEFGFYSAPSANEAEYANGGYFGPRGIESVNRTQSGRVVSREPNLTPITERSEYSNRNSFMSPPMHGPGSLMNPALSQLAGLMGSPDYDGDISLNALLKLRRGAWGGSQASLHSSTGSPRSAGAEGSSPVTGISPWAHGGGASPGDGRYRRQNNGFFIGVVSEGTSVVQSENNSAPASPTLTMNVPSLYAKDGEGQGKEDKDKDKDPRKHRHTLSAESISYLKEDDPMSPSGERWILERRRTGDSGEVEFLGREIVSGGRI